MVGDGHVGILPYSLRLGGATHKYATGIDLATLLLSGRFENSRTAKIYITDAALFLGRLALDNATQRWLDVHAQMFISFSQNLDPAGQASC